MKSVSILGSTGSVGTSTLDVIAANPGLYEVEALTAGKNVDLLVQQAKKHKAKLAVIADESLYSELKEKLSSTCIEVAAGRKAIIDAAARSADYTMAAIVGFAGLEPMMAAIQNGKHVAIANKEPLVAAGKIVLEAAKKSGATLLPVDSEHNAIFQVLEEENRKSISRLILTASGGPFRATPLDQLGSVTPEQALKHPNWSMGDKLTIDSSTMMNKALEVIEAHHLFAMPPEKIDVLIHPQSIIHSMVEYEDGSILAQMGPSDMKVPIAHTLGWPSRVKNDFEPFDFTKVSGLTFENVDARRFPAINLAYDCLKQGAESCLAFNAANETAVAAFLERRIGYLDIFEIVRETIEKGGGHDVTTLDNVILCDQKVRDLATQCIVTRTTSNRKVS